MRTKNLVSTASYMLASVDKLCQVMPARSDLKFYCHITFVFQLFVSARSVSFIARGISNNAVSVKCICGVALFCEYLQVIRAAYITIANA